MPYVPSRLRPETAEAVVRAGYPVEWRPLTDDEGYYRLFAELWADGKTFVVVEQDIVPHPSAVADLLACPAPRCAYQYEYPPLGINVGFGCCKFSAELTRRYPHTISSIDTWAEHNHPPRHWCRLEARVQMVLDRAGALRCTHGLVQHLGRDGPSHGCVARADLERMRPAWTAQQIMRSNWESFLSEVTA